MLLMITQSSSSLVLSHGASVTSGARAAGTARVRLACWLRRLLAAGGAAPWIQAAGSKDTEAGSGGNAAAARREEARSGGGACGRRCWGRGWTVFHLPSTPWVIDAVRSDLCGSDSAESEADLVVVVLRGLMARWVAQAWHAWAACSVWSSSPSPW